MALLLNMAPQSEPRRLQICSDALAVITSTCSNVREDLSALEKLPVTLMNPDCLEYGGKLMFLTAGTRESFTRLRC